VAGAERGSDSATLQLCPPGCLVTGCRVRDGTLSGDTLCDQSVDVGLEGVKILLKGFKYSAAQRRICTEHCCNSDLSLQCSTGLEVIL